MISETTPRFWQCFELLPKEIKEKARNVFQLFQKNPYHPSLHFKRLPVKTPIYSARISRSYRALCIVEGDDAIWFWIGSHSDYEKMIKSMRDK